MLIEVHAYHRLKAGIIKAGIGFGLGDLSATEIAER
jgi:hypothetical protein